MNSLIIDKRALEWAHRQFCLDTGIPWDEYVKNPARKTYIRKTVYKEKTFLIDSEGARNYEGRNDFFHAIICLGQLFLTVDEQIYDWAVETYLDYPVEWFCEYGNLRRIDEKLKEYGHEIKDTHVYFLPEADSVGEECCGIKSNAGEKDQNIDKGDTKKPHCIWYDQKEILNFRKKNLFTSAICFSKTQPDMLAVAALKDNTEPELLEKIYDQSVMSGMAGVSADGMYLWQIGINVVPEAAGKGLAAFLVRTLKNEVIRRGKIPFYGTGEAHTVSQTVGLKAGFVPAWTEVYVR